jgi:hypothetical protein
MKMILFTLFVSLYTFCFAQNVETKKEMVAAAKSFLQGLKPEQKAMAQFSFDDNERYKWSYVPMERKGIAVASLNAAQHAAAMSLLRTALSPAGFAKTRAVMQLETVLKALENRGADDHYRDTGKYYFSIFGTPADDSIWGWRLDGHHVSFNFSSDAKELVSGTPGFLGANPAVVPSGAEKGKEVLKEETSYGFALLHSLDSVQKKKAIIHTKAPSDIITRTDRNAVINELQGVLYSELSGTQQKLLLQLLHLYLGRYKEPAKMWKDIEEAGLAKLRFAWAGAQQPGIGNPHYYRIQGPTVIIEYDNTQNNANHIHTVIRDLKNDFGGDVLLEHYRNGKH